MYSILVNIWIKLFFINQFKPICACFERFALSKNIHISPLCVVVLHLIFLNTFDIDDLSLSVEITVKL